MGKMKDFALSKYIRVLQTGHCREAAWSNLWLNEGRAVAWTGFRKVFKSCSV